MNQFLWQTYHRLIRETQTTHYRYLYDQLTLEKRLLGIVGPRGVGKTTLMLQYIKNHCYKEAFYCSLDNIFFNTTSPLTLVDELYQRQGIKFFFLDEVHKYPHWDQCLKNLYDSFPEIKICFSGSSTIDLTHGAYDLSRRAKLLYLPGLSFREYLNFKLNKNFQRVEISDLLNNHIEKATELTAISTLLQHFDEYVHFGYYPIVFEGRDDLYDALLNIVNKTIHEDIANFYNLKTPNLSHFQKILNYLASIPPGKVTVNSIAIHLGVDNKTADHFLQILRKTGMVKFLTPLAVGSQILCKPEKVYLDNTTLLTALNTILSTCLNTGTIRELAFLQFTTGAKLKAHFSKKGDFQVNDALFEIGGKNKTAQQLKDHPGKKYIIKDDILTGYNHQIPLYLFGFLY